MSSDPWCGACEIHHSPPLHYDGAKSLPTNDYGIVELHTLLEDLIRKSCPTDEQCEENGDECFQLHPIHEASSRLGKIETVYCNVEGLAKVIANYILNKYRLEEYGS